jgi:hypothetical protein
MPAMGRCTRRRTIRSNARTAWALAGAVASVLATESARAEPFTLVVMPDTQSESTNTPQVKFPAMTQWIVDNRASMNIRFVAQVGDLVNWETPDSTPPQFQYVNADLAMRTLDTAKIPYAIAIGNHDTAAVGGVNSDGTPCHCGGSAAPGDVHANLRNTSTFNQFFPLSRFIDSRGQYEPSKVDNQFHTFTAGGLDWLVISSELDPRPGAVTWFNKVVSEHPDHNVIYLTHNFLAPSGDLAAAVGYGDQSPQAVWDGLIKGHSNVRFVLSGHLTQTALRQTAGDSGKPVYQILTDYQDEGNGWLRTLQIDPQAKTVKSQVYSPYLKQYKTGPTEEFTLTGVELVPAKTSSNGGASAGGSSGNGGSSAGGRGGSGGRSHGGRGGTGAGGRAAGGAGEMDAGDSSDGSAGAGTTGSGAASAGGSSPTGSGGAAGDAQSGGSGGVTGTAGGSGANAAPGDGGTNSGEAGVPEGSGGDGVEIPAGEAGFAGDGEGTSNGAAPDGSDAAKTSCGCRLATTPRPASGASLGVMVFALLWKRRARRSRAA